MRFKVRWPLHHAACPRNSWQAIPFRLFTELKDRRLGHYHIFILFFLSARVSDRRVCGNLFHFGGYTRDPEACTGKTSLEKQYRSYGYLEFLEVFF